MQIIFDTIALINTPQRTSKRQITPDIASTNLQRTLFWAPPSKLETETPAAVSILEAVLRELLGVYNSVPASK
jgi:hypothetical protein